MKEVLKYGKNKSVKVSILSGNNKVRSWEFEVKELDGCMVDTKRPKALIYDKLALLI